MSDEKSKSSFELKVELLKALAWPVFGLAVLLSFWSPLREAAKELPRLMREAESVSIYQFSIKVKEKLQRQETPEVAKVLASPEVERVLARLSSDGIQKLLNFRYVSCWQSGKDDIQMVKDVNKELLQFGLLKELPDMNACLKNQGAQYDYALGPSDLGKATQEFIFAFITQSAQELATGPPARD